MLIEIILLVTLTILYIILFIFNDFSVPRKNGLFEGKRIMGIFAHPDDEILIGGTLLKSNDAYLLCLTKGEASEVVDKKLLQGTLTQAREKEFAKSSEILGVKKHFILDFKDTKLKEENQNNLMNEILRHLKKVKPDLIITWGSDGFTGYRDHIVTNKVVTKAYEKYKKQKHDTKLLHVGIPKIVYKNIEKRVTLPKDYVYHRPNVRVNIFGKNLEKYKALLQHKTQVPILRRDAKIPLWLPVFLVFNEYYYEVPD